MAFKVILKKEYGNDLSVLYPDLPKSFQITSIPTGNTLTKGKYTIPIDHVLIIEDLS